MSLIIVVEGDTDIPVAHALASDAGLEVTSTIDMAGKGNLDDRLSSFNDAAKGSPWLVLRDLDDDARCAGGFIRARAFVASVWMRFRLAVHEIESWLLADVEALARFLRVDARHFPREPDRERDPTQTLVNLARQSPRTEIRKSFVPPAGGNTPVGPLYEAKIIEFASRHWNLDRACQRSPSLKRARASLRDLASAWEAHVRNGG